MPSRHKAEAPVETGIAFEEHRRGSIGADKLEAVPDQGRRDALPLGIRSDPDRAEDLNFDQPNRRVDPPAREHHVPNHFSRAIGHERDRAQLPKVIDESGDDGATLPERGTMQFGDRGDVINSLLPNFHDERAYSRSAVALGAMEPRDLYGLPLE